jgi:enamine deaminase RidA (YjgF/YER057c/UK114 family)
VQDSHVCLIEASVSAARWFGIHPPADYRGVGVTERESSVEDRLRRLGVELPRPPRALGAFAPAKVAGNLLFISGAYGTQPEDYGDADDLPIRGQLGAELTVAEGQESARLVALNLLAMARAVLGTVDRVESVVRLVGYINAAPGFVGGTRVLDGASRLLIDVFGEERGSHARMALYQPSLPGGAPVTAELLLELRGDVARSQSRSSEER